MGTRDDLIAAKALIDTPEKWRRDSFSHDPDTCCAVVAVRRAALFHDEIAAARLALFDALPGRMDCRSRQQGPREGTPWLLGRRLQRQLGNPRRYYGPL